MNQNITDDMDNTELKNKLLLSDIVNMKAEMEITYPVREYPLNQPINKLISLSQNKLLNTGELFYSLKYFFEDLLQKQELENETREFMQDFIGNYEGLEDRLLKMLQWKNDFLKEKVNFEINKKQGYIDDLIFEKERQSGKDRIESDKLAELYKLEIKEIETNHKQVASIMTLIQKVFQIKSDSDYLNILDSIKQQTSFGSFRNQKKFAQISKLQQEISDMITRKKLEEKNAILMKLSELNTMMVDQSLSYIDQKVESQSRYQERISFLKFNVDTQTKCIAELQEYRKKFEDFKEDAERMIDENKSLIKEIELNYKDHQFEDNHLQKHLNKISYYQKEDKNNLKKLLSLLNQVQ